MRSRLIGEEGGRKTFVLVFETGDEAMSGLTAFAREQRLSAAQLTGIGAFSEVELGYFDWEKKEYEPIGFSEQVEVLALVGDVALDGGEPAVHAHVVVGRSDGSAGGGHLLRGRVRPTLEVVVTESPAHLRKRYDRESGLALIALGDGDEPPAGSLQGETSLPRVPSEDTGVVARQAQRLVADEQVPRSATEEGAGLEAERDER